MSEIFAVGDTVVYQGEFIDRPLTCKVTRVMPSERAGSYYHIRDLGERFERSVPGYTLTRDTREHADTTFVTPNKKA